MTSVNNRAPGKSVADEVREIVAKLPPSDQTEVRDFAKYLREKDKRPRTSRVRSFSWRGALKHLRDEYTSVELQHDISRQRADDAAR